MKPSGWWVWTGKALRPYPRPVRHAVHSGRGRGPVFHYFLSHRGRGFPGFSIKNAAASPPGSMLWSRASDNDSWPLWQRLPGNTVISPGRTCCSLPAALAWPPAFGHQLLPPLPGPVRKNRHCLRLPGPWRTWWTTRKSSRNGAKEDGISVHLTIDREQPEWTGHVGFVPNYVKELGFDTSRRWSCAARPL